MKKKRIANRWGKKITSIMRGDRNNKLLETKKRMTLNKKWGSYLCAGLVFRLWSLCGPPGTFGGWRWRGSPGPHCRVCGAQRGTLGIWPAMPLLLLSKHKKCEALWYWNFYVIIRNKILMRGMHGITVKNGPASEMGFQKTSNFFPCK